METVELLGDGNPSASMRMQPKSVSNTDLATPVLPQLPGKAGAEVGNRQKIIRLDALPSTTLLVYPSQGIEMGSLSPHHLLAPLPTTGQARLEPPRGKKV